ncbi:hypothetical protein BDZ91DRAFT_718421 [Kalaharituber pfeilii]|nr:hypothetical protein BDZ91DRAFT_718421 [Kalaharituber pfeilii]
MDIILHKEPSPVTTTFISASTSASTASYASISMSSTPTSGAKASASSVQTASSFAILTYRPPTQLYGPHPTVFSFRPSHCSLALSHLHRSFHFASAPLLRRYTIRSTCVNSYATYSRTVAKNMPDLRLNSKNTTFVGYCLIMTSHGRKTAAMQG